MAQTGNKYPYDATLNPDGYKAGTLEEQKAKTWWAKPENTNKASNPFPPVKIKPSPTPSPSASPSGGTPSPQPSPSGTQTKAPDVNDYNTSDSGAALDDYGNPVEGSVYVTVNGKQVLTTIGEQYKKAFSNTKYLKFVRDQLVANGQLSSKERDRKTVLKKFQEVLIGASQSKQDITTYLKDLKASGFGVAPSGSGQDMTPQRTVTQWNEGTVTDLIKSVYKDKLNQEPDDATIKDLLTKWQKKNTGTVTEYKKVKNKKTGKMEMVSTVTPGFTTDLAKIELEKQLKTQNPEEWQRRKAFEFSDSLNQIMSGGM